ncbi:MAG: TetR/AcrR family transcriptional regulator [Ancrocorticia sp.]
MPKIDAPTVREHHAMVKAKLIAATEEILHESGPEGLSAGAVAKRAGIARNSIYRYVDSVDDLKFLALEQYVPRWIQLIFSQVDRDAEPAQQLADFAVASLRQTRESSHGWLMSIMRTDTRKQQGSAVQKQAEGDIQGVHTKIVAFMSDCWTALGVDNARVWAGYTNALIFESFKMSERGIELEELERHLRVSVRALTEAARSSSESGGD